MWFPYFPAPGTPAPSGYNGIALSVPLGLSVGEPTGVISPTIPPVAESMRMAEQRSIDFTDAADGVLWVRRSHRLAQRRVTIDWSRLSNARRTQLLEVWDCVHTTLMFTATLPGETAKWWIFADDTLRTLRRTAAVSRASIELLEIVRTAEL